VRIGTGLSRELAISMPSVGAFSSSPSVTSQRQNRRIPRSRVLMVDGSQFGPVRPARRRWRAGSARPAPARRPRSVSHRQKYRTLWLYSSTVRGASAAARRCRRKDGSRASSRIAGAAHGLPWSVRGRQETRQAGAADADGMATFHAGGGIDALANSYMCAHGLLANAFRLLD
jgi:hypothetical protein